MTNDELTARIIAIEYMQAMTEAMLPRRQLAVLTQTLVVAKEQVFCTTGVSDAAVDMAVALLAERKARIDKLVQELPPT